MRQRHLFRGNLWKRTRVRARWPRSSAPLLQLQLARGLRRPDLWRHTHLVARMSLPVRDLPRRGWMPDDFLQGRFMATNYWRTPNWTDAFEIGQLVLKNRLSQKIDSSDRNVSFFFDPNNRNHLYFTEQNKDIFFSQVQTIFKENCQFCTEFIRYTT